MSEIKSIGEWKTNAELIADVAQLGYLPEPVLDLTYGKGNFWGVWEPLDFCRNDRNPERGVTHEDFRLTGFGSRQFASVVFDPPYKLAGTPASGDMDDAFGTEIVRTRSELLSLLVSGIAEGARLTREYLLVKTMDMVSSGKVRWQTQAAIDTARALELRLVDSFHLKGGRPQPAGRVQVHARRNYSTLLIFER